MAAKPKYYLETSVIMELIEKPKTDPLCSALWQILSDADDAKCEVFTSTLTMVEVLFAEEEKKNGKPDGDITQQIQTLWDPTGSPIKIITCHELITRESLDLYRAHWKKDGWSKSMGVDLVHLVTAKREKVDKFFTTEGAMAKWAPVMGFKVCRPEVDQAKEPPSLFTDEKPNPG